MSEMQHTVEANTLTLERTFDAPRQAVWDSFTLPDEFVKWWGPKGWVTELKEFRFVEGGANHYGMKCDDPAQTDWYGKYSWGKMVFSRIVPIESFEYIDYFVNEQGVIQADMPSSTTSMRFEELEGKTRIISVTTFESPEALATVMEMGMLEGITQTWDRLEALLKAGNRKD